MLYLLALKFCWYISVFDFKTDFYFLLLWWIILVQSKSNWPAALLHSVALCEIIVYLWFAIQFQMHKELLVSLKHFPWSKLSLPLSAGKITYSLQNGFKCTKTCLFLPQVSRPEKQNIDPSIVHFNKRSSVSLIPCCCLWNLIRDWLISTDSWTLTGILVLLADQSHKVQ